MPDATTSSGHVLRLERRFKAVRERVFKAWTEPEAMKRWKAPGEAECALAEADVRVGGTYRIHMRGPDGTVYRLIGEYREIEEPSRLVYTWKWEHEPDPVETLVTVEFNAVGAETDVILTQTGFTDADDRNRHEMGWSGSFEKLARVV